MKNLFLLFILCLVCTTTIAQDILIKNDGSEENVKIIEVSDDNIRYKKWTNQDGPVYNISTTDIFMIKYSDGTKDIFENKVDKINTTVFNKIPQIDITPKMRKKRIYIGFMLRPQMSVLKVSDTYDYKTETEYIGSSGIRMAAAFGTYIDWYISKYEKNKWYLTSSLTYSFEGGNKILRDKNNLHFDYLNLKVGTGVKGKYAYWNIFTGMGILTSAKSDDYNCYKYLNPVTYLIGTEFGLCIKENWSIGFSYEFKVSDIMKESFFGNGSPSSFNFAWGIINLSYRFGIGKTYSLEKNSNK